MEKNFTLRIIALMTVAFISGLLICRSCNKPQIQTISHNDTIVVLKARVDTLEVERIKVKMIYEKSIDTIYMLDSIAIDSAYAGAIQRLQQLERAGFFKH